MKARNHIWFATFTNEIFTKQTFKTRLSSNEIFNEGHQFFTWILARTSKDCVCWIQRITFWIIPKNQITQSLLCFFIRSGFSTSLWIPQDYFYSDSHANFRNFDHKIKWKYRYLGISSKTWISSWGYMGMPHLQPGSERVRNLEIQVLGKSPNVAIST